MYAESALIERAKGGDLAAFNQLVLAYQGLAYNVAYGLLGDPDGAADATQDSFFKAYHAIGRFWGGSFKAWLLRIVTNTCYDALRSLKRRSERFSSLESLIEENESAGVLRDGHAGPEERAERHELRHLIQLGLDELAIEQRTVVFLYDVEGLSYEEIAEASGMPLGTVKSRLSRGRARLRDYLRAHGVVRPVRQFSPHQVNCEA